MPVYDADGNELLAVYDADGNALTQAYDASGNPLMDGDLPPDVRQDRLLIWHDEFEGTGVNSSKWDHLFGYYNANRYYMYENNLAHNAWCEDSFLHIVNKKDSQMPNTEWTGAFIHTNNIFEFRYGLIEAKIKFPTASVYHGTLWTLGANYERISNPLTQGDQTKGFPFVSCGEMDIAEADNGNVSNTFHWADPAGSGEPHSSSYGAHLTSDASNWHTYSCEWTADTIKIYIDNVLKRTFNVSDADYGDFNAFRLPHFMMLNLNPQLNGTQTLNELEMLVDWVRVYAPVGVTEYITETAVSIPSTLSLSVGQTHLLTAEFTPVNPSDMTTNWSTSNENVAICYGGKITAIGSGTATITVTTKHGCTATCTVTVS